MPSTSSRLFMGDKGWGMTKVDSADSKHLLSETQPRKDHTPRGFCQFCQFSSQFCRGAPQAGLAQLTIAYKFLFLG